MNIIVDIPQLGGGRYDGFAPINLMLSNGERLCQAEIKYTNLVKFGPANSTLTDFLVIASVVYAVDKLVSRSDTNDNWTRSLSVSIPVADITIWNSVKQKLDSCISFLTGDLWEIDFTQQLSSPIRGVQYNPLFRPTGDAVCLLSGGLDSLIGVINWLQSNCENTLYTVGHYDNQIPNTKSDQINLVTKLKEKYNNLNGHVQVCIGHSNQTVENTLRGRSLLFIALGIQVAASLGPEIPLYIPENGTIALNLPLNASRRGSCSTRTANPFYLSQLNDILSDIGITNIISNPLQSKSKGEAVRECLDREILTITAPMSASCAKLGRNQNFTHTDAKACGRCMPCIYRRAALHTIGLDNENFGDDICTGEVDVYANGLTPNDLRSYLAFLKRNPSSREISSMLMANSRLDASMLSEYSETIQRTMDEIRVLLTDKAAPDIKRLAGL